jgi:predicted nucleic acid-binding protein
MIVLDSSFLVAYHNRRDVHHVFLGVLDTFRGQRRTRLSFADAAIVTVARQRGARFIATFDRDFRQVGNFAIVPA